MQPQSLVYLKHDRSRDQSDPLAQSVQRSHLMRYRPRAYACSHLGRLEHHAGCSIYEYATAH